MNERMKEFNDTINGLNTRVDEVEKKQTTIDTNYTEMKQELEQMKKEMNNLRDFKTEQENKDKVAENKAIMTEYHNKKYNSILYNWPEKKAWELPEQSREELNEFLGKVLGIEKADDLMIANCHRLGSVTTDKDGNPELKARPLIFRVLFWKDREIILENSNKLLKDFNLANNT